MLTKEILYDVEELMKQEQKNLNSFQEERTPYQVRLLTDSEAPSDLRKHFKLIASR